ncbi:hypothetical protein BD65_1256 [Yersinia ruckeri]|nr:hypothetical protein BD65_1256 [Yersinia ruckeri]
MIFSEIHDFHNIYLFFICAILFALEMIVMNVSYMIVGFIDDLFSINIHSEY